MFAKKNVSSYSPDNVQIAAGVCEMFLISEQLKMKTLLASSLLSCIGCIFLSTKVGFIYHCNCGYIKDKSDPMITMIKNALQGNKESVQDTKIILAASGTEVMEAKRLQQAALILKNHGFNRDKIQFVYSANQYVVNSWRLSCCG